MERRPKPVTRKPGRRIEKRPVDSNPIVDLLSLPHIAEFIDYGEITLGQMYPVGCVAVAADEHNSLAMLVRREGETPGSVASPTRPSHRQGARRRHLHRRNQSPSLSHSHPHNRLCPSRKHVDTTGRSAPIAIRHCPDGQSSTLTEI